MSNTHEIEDLYEVIGKDAQSWLAQARSLKMSADVLRVVLKDNLQQAPTAPGVADARLALIQSFMLLTGFAFENLIKGVLVASDPSLVRDGKLDTQKWRD